MNEVYEAIKNRRSVRSFSKNKIEQDLVEQIIDAGNHAPSGANVQPWRFVVVQSDSVRKQLAQNASPVYKKFLENAPEVIKNIRKPIDDIVEDSIYYSAPLIIFVVATKIVAYESDAPMVCNNMMLMAKSLGIGSCWVEFGKMGLSPEIMAQLEVNENEKIYGPILFGYPKEGFPDSPPKKPPVVKWI